MGRVNRSTDDERFPSSAADGSAPHPAVPRGEPAREHGDRAEAEHDGKAPHLGSPDGDGHTSLSGTLSATAWASVDGRDGRAEDLERVINELVAEASTYLNTAPAAADHEDLAAHLNAVLRRLETAIMEIRSLSDESTDGDGAGHGRSPLYSIGTASRLVGVAVATLRTWETRYALITPQRSPSGRRLYSRDQLQQLTFVAEQIASGFSAADAHRLLAERLDGKHEPGARPSPPS